MDMSSLFVMACAVCGAGEDDPSRSSYVWMSMIISLLPLALLGGIIGYMVIKTRAAESAQKQPQQAQQP
jgi:hypothetical protein